MSSLFKVLASEKRKDILKLLRRQGMHVSGIARELGISVPVTLKHVQKLEDAGLVSRTRAGNTHIISIREDRLELLNGIWMLLDEPLTLRAERGAKLSDILRTLPEIELRKTKEGSYINAVDGREGFFVYEINGKLTDKAIDACTLEGDVELEIKRLIPALDKKIRIKVG